MISGPADAAALWSRERADVAGFAFVIHPRDLGDVAYKFPLARYLPDRVLTLWTRLSRPLIAGKVTGVRSLLSGAEIPGWIVVCPLTPQQMLTDHGLAVRRVRSAIDSAKRCGAEVVGLGGLLPAVTGGGSAVRNVTGVHLATGRALTPVIVAAYVRDCAEIAGWDVATTPIAVVGAAGAVGAAVARLLVRQGARRLLLIDVVRGRRRLDRTARGLLTESPAIDVTCGDDLDRLRVTPLIVTATNDPNAVIESRHLSPGSIVIDDAQPSDVAADVLRRSDVATIAGGVARIPGVDAPFFRSVFASADENFSCFAEVAALAAHGVSANFGVGLPTEQEIDSISAMAAALGITRGAFQNAARTYDADEIMAIAQLSAKWSRTRDN